MTTCAGCGGAVNHTPPPEPPPVTTSDNAGATLLIIAGVGAFGLIAIVGILAAVALPAYSNYTKRAQFVEVINATYPVKAAVESCYAMTGSLANCNEYDDYTVSAAVEAALGGIYVSDLTVSDYYAVITATGTTAVDNATYTLTPTMSFDGLTWEASGTCTVNGYC